jgi:hypothetical protein
MPQKKSDAIVTEERITTSIKVAPSIWKEFKKYAIDKDREISSLLEEMMKVRVEGAAKKHG